LTGRDVKKPTGQGVWDGPVPVVQRYEENWANLPTVRALRRDNRETAERFLARRPYLRKRYAERKQRKLEAAKAAKARPFVDVVGAVVQTNQEGPRRVV
jgi:hypothetical protein